MQQEKETEIPVFDLSKIPVGPTEKAQKIMEALDSKIFIINNYTGAKYEEFIMTLLHTMLEGYEHEVFRKHPVMYKFNEDDVEEEVKWLPFNHFIINTMLWNPMKWLDHKNLDESFIVQSSEMYKMTPVFIKGYMDEHYSTIYNRHIPDMPNVPVYEINKQLNNIYGRTNFLLSRFSAYFANFFGISSSIETFKNLADKYPELNELFYFKLDPNKQPAEMEQDLLEAQNKLVDIIMNDDEFNPLKPLLPAKCGLNVKQLRDMCINVGMKPDQDGRTIPVPINTNYLVGGLDNPTYYYIGAIPGRKSAIMNFNFMGKTGHLLIMIAISTAGAMLSKTVSDCHSPNPIPIDIKSEEHLKKLNGRTYRRRGEKKYKIIDYRKDKELIGDTAYVRSPITCCAKDGICKACYGNLYYTNVDNYSAGVYGATYLMNPVVQGILSAKHHQTTNTTLIEFPEEFYKFFSIYSTDVLIDPSPDINLMDYCLVIERTSIFCSDEEEEEENNLLDFSSTSNTKKKRRRRKRSSGNRGVQPDSDDILDGASDGESGDDDELELKLPYYVTSFKVAKHLLDPKKETEYIEFHDTENKELFMHTDFIRRMIQDTNEEIGDFFYIPLEDIPQEEFIFVVDVYNNELTKPMKEIQTVLNNNAHGGCDTYEEITNKLLDLIIASKLSSDSVHAEMIVRQLVRKSTNSLKRPDFSRVVMKKDYQLMAVGTALKKNPSICTSLATPYLKAQLVSLTETFNKTAVSVFDPLFNMSLDEE